MSAVAAAPGETVTPAWRRSGNRRRGAWVRLLAASTATAGALLAAGWGLQLDDASLWVPFVYQGDGVAVLALAKGIIETDDYLTNPAIGAPWGRDLHDYPLPEAVNLVALDLLGEVTGHHAAAVNLLYLTGFAFAALAAFAALRGLDVSYPLATSLAVLYAVTPYHFQRGESHLFLSQYFVAPLAILLCRWLVGDRSPRRWWALERRHAFAAIGICALVAGSGPYYAFFASFFLLAGGLFASATLRRLAPLATAALLVAIVTAGFLIQLVPALRYRAEHGDNPQVAQRAPSDAQRYGLRLTEMLSPVPGHRIGAFAKLAATIEESGSAESERTGNLGTVGVAGFLVLLWWLLIPSARRSPSRQLLATLNGAGLLLGTTAGVGALLAVLGLGALRGYNRISIFLVFFALAAVGLFLDGLVSRLGAKGLGPLALVLGVLGVADQVAPQFAPDHAGLRAQWESDAQFVGQLERLLPPGATLFQLPYVPFPESPPRVRMVDYDHFRLYLHSTALQWSYGVMRGRSGDLWQSATAAQPVFDLVPALRSAGYEGVVVDRYGYQDGGRQLVTELGALLGPSLASPDGRLAFFRIREIAAAVALPLAPRVALRWDDGFWGEELGPEGAWRWCDGNGRLTLLNTSQRPVVAQLELRVQTGHRALSRFSIEGLGIHRREVVDILGRSLSLEVVIPPGGGTLLLSSDAPPMEASSDPRRLIFRVLNPQLREAG